ncbi:MAG: 4-(cytidine 5'-diphospho)-2-C-methyl-D-erythritol kinase, partial [Burkholderiales bacterium]|nr:4-(cytidine 5'-diphospho)-2-C-methyl-D-erythritol kinase [Burkholderiales bacterium]
LMQLGLQLGADVPFFLFGRNAFAEGIGEQLQAVATPNSWFVVLRPEAMIPTPIIFSANDLTRDSKAVKIADFSSDAKTLSEFGRNDLQSVAERLFPAVREARQWLEKFGAARMTGSGSCVFCRVADENEADKIIQAAPVLAWKAKALEHHPLANLL